MADLKKSTTPFRSDFGTFELIAYEIGGAEHAALVAGAPAASAAPLVRVQSSCLTGTAFRARLCDCRQQLDDALKAIYASGGVVLYLAQEGRGHGLIEKINHLRAISDGADTVDAALGRGVDPDVRDYGMVPLMLKDLLGEARPIRLLTNNPDKIRGLEAIGIVIAERIPLETDPTDGNSEYLRIKKERMGHLLTRV